MASVQTKPNENTYVNFYSGSLQNADGSGALCLVNPELVSQCVDRVFETLAPVK